MKSNIVQVINGLSGINTSAQPGTLLLKQDPDQNFVPNFSKEGDVGLDLPVKIVIDRIKFGNSGEEPGKLRSPLLYPDLKHFIFPEGDDECDTPFMEVPAFGWAEVPSALSVKLPDDAWGLLKTRSSTAWKKHLLVVTSTIDSGYTGLLGTLVYNPNQKPVRIYEYNPETGEGDCLSQLILIPRYDLREIVLTDKLPETNRGSTGFGSTTKSVRPNSRVS